MPSMRAHKELFVSSPKWAVTANVATVSQLKFLLRILLKVVY